MPCQLASFIDPPYYSAYYRRIKNLKISSKCGDIAGCTRFFRSLVTSKLLTFRWKCRTQARFIFHRHARAPPPPPPPRVPGDGVASAQLGRLPVPASGSHSSKAPLASSSPACSSPSTTSLESYASNWLCRGGLAAAASRGGRSARALGAWLGACGLLEPWLRLGARRLRMCSVERRLVAAGLRSKDSAPRRLSTAGS
jgi:hypothetical protein